VNELQHRMMSAEVGKLQAERSARQKTELERLQAHHAEASSQIEMVKLQNEHAEARHQAALKLQALRHKNRMAKQKLLHQQAMALARRPGEVKREREARAAAARARAERLAVIERLVDWFDAREWHLDGTGRLIRVR